MIRMFIDTSRVERFMNRLPNGVSEKGRMAMKNFGNILVKELLLSAESRGIKQFRRSRSMFTSTRYVQKGDVGHVLMPMSGVYQDSAKPHWVSVTRSKPMLWAWAKRHNFRGGSFYFTPRPFIRRGTNNAIKRLSPIVRTKMRQAIREAH